MLKIIDKKGILDSILHGMEEIAIYYEPKTDMRILWANKAASDSLGLEPSQLIGRYCHEIWHKRRNPCRGCPVVKSLSTRRPEKADIRSPDGRLWQVRSRPILNDKKQITGIIKITSEITEKDRIGQALIESEKKYRILIENLPHKIFFKDKDLFYVYCNKLFLKDLKIGQNEITGKTDYDFFPNKLADKYRQDDVKAIKSGNKIEIEEKYAKDGKIYFVHTIKIPIKDSKGRVIGLIGFFWDITDIKQNEEKLKKRNLELEKTNKLMIGRELKMVELKERIKELEKIKILNSRQVKD